MQGCFLLSCGLPWILGAFVPSYFSRRRNEVSSWIATSTKECSLDDDDIFACLAEEGYVEDSSAFATISKVYVAEIESLRDFFPSYEDSVGSNVMKKGFNKRRRHLGELTELNSHVANLEYNQLIGENELILVDTVRKPGMQSVSRAFRRAGPRKILHFDPSHVNAAIVTCGGLCPGLNNVIRELVHSLTYLYGANKVWGVVGGFHGFHKKEYEPIHLTNELVENIHHDGGTVLRSSRGGFDVDKIISFPQEKDISQLYVIGGDGTHRAAYKIHDACMERKLNIAVAGIPKTIDNDVDYIDRSFGFVSAVQAAQTAIRTAKTGRKAFDDRCLILAHVDS
jgi:6-phosphofructokinase 1